MRFLAKATSYLLCSFLLTLSLLGCDIPTNRRTWQDQKEFKNHRSTQYNKFIEEGGMIKRDELSLQETQKLNQAKRDLLNDSNSTDQLEDSQNSRMVRSY